MGVVGRKRACEASLLAQTVLQKIQFPNMFDVGEKCYIKAGLEQSTDFIPSGPTKEL